MARTYPGRFDWALLHFPTVEAFRAHLHRHDPSVCRWVRKLVVHHTWRPTLDQWRGARSMGALERYYRDQVVWKDSKGKVWRGWPAAPHLFIAPDGIWQGTPMNLPGVHAGVCNSVSIGLEFVGDYDVGPWTGPVRALGVGALAALMDWLRLPVLSIVGHRDCNSPKSCPGRAVDLNMVRLWVAAEASILP